MGLSPFIVYGGLIDCHLLADVDAAMELFKHQESAAGHTAVAWV
jgi:hypothetical protein